MPNLADILFRAADGVYAVDSNQRIIYWNTACEQLFGIPCKHALGQPCSEVVRGKDHKGQPFCGGGCCANLVKGGTGPKTFPLQTHDRDGNELSLTVNLVLVPSRRDNYWTCVHMLHRGYVTDVLDTLKYYSPHQRKTQRGSAKKPSVCTQDTILTEREHEILELLAEGVRAPLISSLLHVSPVTVRNHIQHIVSKLGVHSQLEAVAYAYRHGLLENHDVAMEAGR